MIKLSGKDFFHCNFKIFACIGLERRAQGCSNVESHKTPKYIWTPRNSQDAIESAVAVTVVYIGAQDLLDLHWPFCAFDRANVETGRGHRII